MANVVNRGFGGNLTKSQMIKENREDFTPIFNGRAMRPPVRMLYIYSVAKRSFTKNNPPLFPKLHLAGCEDGERYVRCCAFGDPITQASPDNERGGTRSDEHDAMIAAIDLLVPGNFTLDQYAGINNPTYFANANGTNLVCEGVFVSENEVPTEEEIKRAESTRDRRYRYLVGEARRLANVSRKDLDEFLQRWPDTHIAMDALGMESDWHAKNEFKQSCPNCGDIIKAGIAAHMSTLGNICVLDPERAFKAGAINRDRYEELSGKKIPGRKPQQVEEPVTA